MAARDVRLRKAMNMVSSKNCDEALRDDLSGQELTEDQLSLVIGAAGSQRTAIRRLSLTDAVTPAQPLAPLVLRRVPVIRPEQAPTQLFGQFDLAGLHLDLVGIHPDLEEPWPKPKEPPTKPSPPPPPPSSDIFFTPW